MSDVLKIVCAIGVGLYSIIGLHLYSILVSRSKNDWQRLALYLLCILIVIGGGIIGCCAIMGALYDTGHRLPSTDSNMRFIILMSWIGTVWVYMILSRNFRKRLAKAAISQSPLAGSVPQSQLTSPVKGDSDLYDMPNRCVMTKQEFIFKQQAYKNISGKGAVIAVCLVFAFACSVVGICVLISVVKDQVRPALFQNVISSTLIAFLTVFVAVSFQLLLRHFRLRMTKLGLLCTGCGAPLIGTASRVVMATGCCKRCGKRAISELPDT